MLLEHPSSSWKDYELLDSGNFQKLERFGPYVMIRPEPKALWDRELSQKEWKDAANFEFTPGAGFAKAGKEDSGTWKILRKAGEQWVINYSGTREADSVGLKMSLRLGLTAFKHIGVFPEQATNWDFIYRNTREIVKSNASSNSGDERIIRPKVLNLFAYTGAASLAACAAGADVTHLDSVKQVVTWAKTNMELSNMDMIRWVVEDALAFVKREVRRGHQYQGLILDPPAYGHGTDGAVWKLDECLYELLTCCASILAPKESFMVLNLYSNGYSAQLADTAVRRAFKGKLDPKGGKAEMEFGESALMDRFGKALPLSVFSRIRR